MFAVCAYWKLNERDDEHRTMECLEMKCALMLELANEEGRCKGCEERM